MMESTNMLGGLGRQCKNCVYFGLDFKDSGTCHRHAPKPVVFDYKDSAEMCIHQPTIWPEVNSHEFCGEFLDEAQFHSFNE